MKLYDFLYHPKKASNIENKKAFIIGGGIAGLAAAAFLIDDAGMPGSNITIYEKRNDVGAVVVLFQTKVNTYVLVKENLNHIWNVFGTYVVKFLH